MIEFNVLRDFEWHRDKKGYRLVIYDKKWVTISNGERSDSIGYRPFAGGGDLCAAFAAVSTPDRLLRFVNDHGPLKTGLRRSEDEPVVRYPTVSPVDSDLKCAEEFREVLRLKAQGRPKKLASYFEGYWHSVGRVFLVGDSKWGVRFEVRPPHLLGALWYQLGLKLSYATLRMCKLCHCVFEAGPGTGLRADAKFCCHEHKVEFFNHSRPRLIRRSKPSRQ